MTGDLIAFVARRLLRERTYDLTVAPAIADCGFEAETRLRARRFFGYLSISRALAGALTIDIGDDLAIAFNREARSTAWRTAAHVFGALFLFNLFSESRLIFDLATLGIDAAAAVFMWRLPDHAAATLPVLLIPVAIVLTRRLGNAVRPVLISAAIVSCVFAAVSVAVVVPSTRTAEHYRQAAYWRARMDAADSPRTLEAVRQELTAPIMRPDQRRARADRNRFLTHDILSRSAGTFAFALIGIAFARTRGWRAVSWAGLAFLSYSVVLFALIEMFLRLYAAQVPAGVPWSRTFALFLVGTLALLVARRRAVST